MILFPAIDLSDGKAVRLLRGDYNQKTVFSDDPLSVARDFVASGATHVHLVDLDGAKDGTIPNMLALKPDVTLSIIKGGEDNMLRSLLAPIE